MKERLLLALLLVAGWAGASAQSFQGGFQPDTGGAMAAIHALPARYRDNIVKLSADNGNPDPSDWYFLAKRDSGEVYSITVSQGQVTSERISLNLGALLGNPSPINLSRLAVGSDGAWAAALKFCAKKGKPLGSVSYVLQQQGRDAAPVWSVWCYTPKGSYIGMLRVLGTTGAVISSE